MAKDIFSLSDDEIENMAPPEESGDTPTNTEEDAKDDSVNDVTTEETDSSVETNEDTTSTNEKEEEEDSSKDSAPDDKQEDSTAKEGEDSTPTDTVDYKKFYETVTGSIKANGKEVKFSKPDEIIRLMQMGANYTQKMQNLAPYRKKIQTLQKAGLLDDDKLNYLIDLSQGNPEAVKKLLRDSKLDPMDLDIQNEPKYIPGNHAVSDAEARLQNTLDDLTSTPEGTQTVQIAGKWDQASLSEIGKDPSILSTLHEQRMNGVFDFIVNEMDRQKMLGNIPEGTPFLKAYKAVGDYCLQQMQYQKQQQMQQINSLPQGTVTKPVDTTKAQVKSAAPTGRGKKPVSHFVDPFSLSDEEFEKQFKNYN